VNPLPSRKRLGTRQKRTVSITGKVTYNSPDLGKSKKVWGKGTHPTWQCGTNNADTAAFVKKVEKTGFRGFGCVRSGGRPSRAQAEGGGKEDSHWKSQRQLT